MLWKTNFGKLLEKLNLGFKRPERLDVKKPGPRFDNVKAFGKKKKCNKLLTL